MKIADKLNQKVDNSDSQLQMLPEDAELLKAANVPFSDFLVNQFNPDSINEQTSLLGDIDFTFDSLTMNLEDALFFVNLTQNGQFNVNTTQNDNFSELIKTEVTQNVVSKRSVEVTNQLTNLIEKAMKTQKPVRISFDNNVSVVIKIDKAGKVSAEFIPGSSEVENYLRNNISSLKQKFDEQNLPYNDLLYRQNGRQGRQNRNRNKGE